MARSIIETAVRKTADNIVNVTAEIRWRSLEPFGVALGSGFSEKSDWWAEFQWAVRLSEGAGEVDVMLCWSVTVYLKNLILWASPKLAEAAGQVCFYILCNIL